MKKTEKLDWMYLTRSGSPFSASCITLGPCMVPLHMYLERAPATASLVNSSFRLHLKCHFLQKLNALARSDFLR